MADRHQNIVAVAGKPLWRTPMLSEDSIAELTQATIKSAGDDGFDQFVGYETTGLS